MSAKHLPYSPKLAIWYLEAYKEFGIEAKQIDINHAIFPKRLYKTVESFDHSKIYDFCFIGAFLIDRVTAKNRAWILDFIRSHFSKTSYLQFTDKNTKQMHKEMGEFDHTFKRNGFVPKEVELSKRNYFDDNYYKVMCQAEFTLCPAGDVNWSMRFYESLMCKSIPILLDNHAFRTASEAQHGYKVFYACDDHFKFSIAWAEHNYQLFLKHHTLAESQSARY